MTNASNPLLDSLFRPTTLSAAGASAAPVRVRGTRSRAGNAMTRTRSALMAGAAQAVATSGTKITMAQVATCAGVAKATLYNHFRTREAVLDALVLHQIDQLIESQTGKPLELALIDTALTLSSSPVLRGLADLDPAALATLGRIEASAAGWRLVHEAVASTLDASGRAGVDIVVRWLASFVLSPADPASIAADVAVLVSGLPVVEPTVAIAEAEASGQRAQAAPAGVLPTRPDYLSA